METNPNCPIRDVSGRFDGWWHDRVGSLWFEAGKMPVDLQRPEKPNANRNRSDPTGGVVDCGLFRNGLLISDRCA